MNRTIEVTVSPQGETTVRTRGYTGGECLAASRFLEEAIGTVSADHKTSDYYRPATEQHQQLEQ